MSSPEVPKQFLSPPPNQIDLSPAGRQFLQQIAAGGGGSGTVTDVTASDDGNVLLTVTNPTTTPNIAGALADTAVTPGSYTNADITVDQQGRITAASNGSSGSGTVTSVGLTVPTEFSVSGSPVTTSGTLAVSKATQSANTVWAGPTTGSAAAPTFRALNVADFGGIGLALISKQIVTGSPAASIQFASIPQTFSDLIISLWCRSTSTTVTDSQVYLRVNNDNQSSHYTSARYVAGLSGTTASTGNILATSNGGSIAYCPGTSSNGAAIGDGQIYIPAYTNGAFAHTIHSTSFEFWGAQYVALRGFAYLITGPITQIDLFPENGSFEVGSQFCLYGRG